MNTEEPSRSDPSEELAKRIAYLINGYNLDNLTVSEHQELDDWVTASMRNQQLFEELTDPANLKKWMRVMEKLDGKAALERIKSRIEFEKAPRSFLQRKFRIYWAAAAVIIGMIYFGVYQVEHTGSFQFHGIAMKNDILPGGKHAVLTLGNSSSILLDTAQSGNIITGEGGIQITKDGSGLNYTMAGKMNTGMIFNELTTPAGGEYEVRLSDGTRVWLNASSSLKYPEGFTDSVRKVELTGEGYFEVAKDAAHPFIVSKGNNEVRVLGTHFNVNGYTDNRETIVTLAEGSVELNASVMLKPGEQGSIDPDGRIQTSPADLETALAWKDGQFIFKKTPMEQIMRQVSHWYDARIIYQDNVSEHFNARIPRGVPVSKLIHLLEATGQVHFKIEDRTITVMR
ncbi:MAG TPA: FecR domain-containing protein [Puia sp.]|jgi:transmembrane sensor|nr:FecR domain-containing protein [Puia sp.]